MARDVEEQVGGESEDLLADEVEQGVERGVTEVVLPVDFLVGCLWDSEIRAGLGNVDLILLHGSVVRVVAMVRNSP